MLVKYTGTDAAVTIPDGVTAIGNEAFRLRKKVTTVIIPDSVTEIGSYVFTLCPKLTTVCLPAALKVLKSGTFSSCSSLTHFQFPTDAKAAAAVWKLLWEHYWQREGKVFLLGCVLAHSPDMLRQRAVREAVKRYAEDLACAVIRREVPAQALAHLITEFPSLNNEAMWQRCLALAREEENVEAIALLIERQKNLPPDDFNLSDENEETLRVSRQTARRESLNRYCAEGVTFAVSGRLNYFSSKEHLKQHLHRHGGLMCGSVTRDTDYLICDERLDNAATRLAADYGVPRITERGLLRRLHEDGFVIEDGVLRHYVGEDAAIAIPDGVTVIGKYAFDRCHSALAVTIPDGVTEIQKNAFNWCIYMASVTIPASVQRIDDLAFYSCFALKEFRLPAADTDFNRVWRMLWDVATRRNDVQMQSGLMQLKNARK